MRSDADAPAGEAEFIREYPEHATTAHLDRRRAMDYRRRDTSGHVDEDYTGGSRDAESQVREHAALLNASVAGNPHSASRTSATTTMLVERARRAVLDWFNAGSDYTAVFTSNATGALKHVA